MKCRLCGGEMVESKKSWSCENRNCGLVVWKEIGRRAITRKVAEELMRLGRTGVMEFKTKEGKPFAAALVVKNGKVEYEFPKNAKKNDDCTVDVRVEAGSSGRCYLSIRGAVVKQAEVNFGLVSATEAECLALITAAKYVAHYNGSAGKCLIKVSLNNLNLSRYILKERSPRDRWMKELVNLTRKALDQAGKWEVEYRPERRPRLKGGPVADTFPFGVFPWLEAKVRKENGRLL
ncbi:MAG: topoisomerase C-terminal repeat-containing protein, partial [Bacillota bacterium]